MTSNLPRIYQDEHVSRKVRRLALSSQLRKLGVPRAFLLVALCTLSSWLDCIPLFFPGLKAKDRVLIINFLRLLGHSSRSHRYTFADFFAKSMLMFAIDLQIVCYVAPSAVLKRSGLFFYLSPRSIYRLLHSYTSK